jgi:DNA processing protein
VNRTEPEYPQSLLQIYDPPVALYVRGDASILDAPTLAIVGTRRPTVYGTLMADRMGAIVSGLPGGVDAIAHQGATAVGGRDRGSGHGYRRLLPEGKQETLREAGGSRRHRQRVPHWQSSGSLENFPVRNRIIAGMPIGVIIVEGKQYCGSLITAPLALEFGREVSGVPGNVTQDVSFAPNLLINQGAKLVTNAEDVIEELPAPVRATLVQLEAVESEQRNLLVADGLTPTEKKIYELLSAEESGPIDARVETGGLNSSEVLATLLTLELKGIVRQLPGKPFDKALL